jgi:NhaP-type Na+/H+ or K+/H+ antiporter
MANLTLGSHTVGVGWIIALLVLIGCFIMWLVGGVTMPIVLGLVAALALAYLIG